MGRLFLSIVFIATSLVACDKITIYEDGGPAPAIDAGWHYSWNDELPAIGYGFHGQTGGFFGHCDAEPIFALLGVTYSPSSTLAVVKVGKLEYKFSINPRYSQYILFGDADKVEGKLSNGQGKNPNFVQALAAARKSITVETNRGERWIIPTSDYIARFAQECADVRSAESPKKASNSRME